MASFFVFKEVSELGLGVFKSPLKATELLPFFTVSGVLDPGTQEESCS